jgi:1-acyl-sn-glycerol-3-phosphate acyltransferase
MSKTRKPPKEYPWDRVKPYPFYRFAQVVFGALFLHIPFRTKVIGRENLPKSARGIILASNHLHSIDPIFFASASRRTWRFIAKIELFQNRFVAWFFKHCNGFPLDRDIIDRRALDYALRVMADGRAGLGIFPEGQRSKDGVPHEAKSGIAMLAREAKAGVLPCSIWHDGPLKFRTKITIRFGPVIPFEELGLGETPNKRQSRAACEKIMAEITRLWEQGDGWKH